MTASQLMERVQEDLRKDYRLTFMERVRLLLETEDMFTDSPPALRYASTLRHILSGISKPVRPDEAILGSVNEEIPSEEERLEVERRYEIWWDIPLEEIQKKMLFYYSDEWRKCRAPWFISLGHLALDWESLIGEGLGGLRAKALKRLENETESAKRSFLSGAVQCYEAITEYILSYAQAAKAAGAPLQGERLERVASGPAKSFADALQLIWSVTLVAQKVCGCGVLNFSRMDQYLYPLYAQDTGSGVLTREAALELIREFYFKNNEIMAAIDHMSIETTEVKHTLEVTFDDPNYLTLGGLLPSGASGVNELSYLMVQAAHELRLRNPFIVVRYHSGIDGRFLDKVCAAMRDNATLVIYNDETMIKALKEFGVKEPEVYDYGFFGCNDPNIPAEEGGLRQLWFNLARPLELVLNRGDYPLEPKGDNVQKDCEFPLYDRMTSIMRGAYYGVDMGDVDAISDMAEFMRRYREQVRYLMREFRKGFERDMALERSLTDGRMRIEDCFLRGTVDAAKSWTFGGTKYHKIVNQAVGLATVADSLYAIEKLVFIDKRMSMSELAALLRSDYAGNDEMPLFLKKRIDKFGNDLDHVDRYAAEIADIFAGEMLLANGPEYLYQMWPTISSDRAFTLMGTFIGATPDGRKAREPLSENQSPAEGMDVSGLTALLNSVSKLPFRRITGGPLNIRVHPGSVAGEEGLKALAALLRTYLESGGMQIQMNVVDAKTLREAQKNPDAYRGLCVRVTGYSAFFTQMGKQAQEELIRRTELCN